MAKCEWCGVYYKGGVLSYLRDNSGMYKRYVFCSNQCCYAMKDKTGMIFVNENGNTDSEQKEIDEETRKRNINNKKLREQRIVKEYGSIEKYEQIQRQRVKDIVYKATTHNRKKFILHLILYFSGIALITLFCSNGWELLSCIVFYVLWQGLIRNKLIDSSTLWSDFHLYHIFMSPSKWEQIGLLIGTMGFMYFV